MEESFYHNIADAEMAKLLEFAEKLEETSDIEAEYDSGVLTITLPNKRQFVINKHTPSRQIWVSSPKSGASYFEYADGKWLSKRSGDKIELFEFITNEFG